MSFAGFDLKANESHACIKLKAPSIDVDDLRPQNTPGWLASIEPISLLSVPDTGKYVISVGI
jgi:hypothetical protein